jgi:hypothetical protein
MTEGEWKNKSVVQELVISLRDREKVRGRKKEEERRRVSILIS